MANADWEIERINKASAPESHAAKDTSYPFLRQMAALYNPDMYTKDIVLEMYFTDLVKRISFYLAKKTARSKLKNSPPAPPESKLPFQIWLRNFRKVK